MKLLDTLSGEKKEFIPREKGKVNLFVCGPTVYDLSHIGHAKTYVFFDVLAKYLRYLGFEVFYLQNITDIDDKIIARAKEEKKDPLELAENFKKEYLSDMESLGINGVTKYAQATEYISQIVNQVKILKEKGFAYLIDGEGYYFDLSKFPDYGKLSGRTMETAEDSISRIDENVKKRNKGDFALWKLSASDSESGWITKIGRGRPGWHIEDTAITETYFGFQYDIHGGAIDLKFPHHEAEIAQQESASGQKPLVNYWLHTGFLTVGGQKMAKSLANFITIRDVLKKYDKKTVRLYLLSVHYRSPLDYGDRALDQARSAGEKMADFLSRLDIAGGAENMESDRILKEAVQKFASSMDDDLNTPEALSAIFSLIRKLNPFIVKNEISRSQAENIKKFFRQIDLLLDIVPEPKTANIPQEINELVEKREELRIGKDWPEADKIRKQIEKVGYKIDDTVYGPLIRR